MQLRQLDFAIITMISFNLQYAAGECPKIYQMVDPHHSFCAEKKSLHSSPPGEKEIEHILQVHNQERMDVNAKHMQKMYWNRDLAEIAQRYADHCHYDHDKSIQRQAPRVPLSTGQNLAMGYHSWYQAIRAWADEKTHFIYGSPVQNGVVGHYTQMVKDTAALIGCGLATCPKSKVNPYHDWSHYVCNYVTGQLGDNKPYTPAVSSQSHDQRLHDCQGLVCLYGGTIDLDTCRCQCESYTSGRQCENLDCSSLSDQCDYGTDKALCRTYANVPQECPKFCGLCDRYDEMKKHYDTLDLIANAGHFHRSFASLQAILMSLALLFI